MSSVLTEELLLAFYGDDFTGSTDAMEVMAFAGLKTVLFTRAPSLEDMKRFAGYQVIGIAGTARAQSPKWMDSHLPSIFQVLNSLQPKILHYKVCSTFDSAPHIGSIGRAIDIGVKVTGSLWSPSIVGAPQLRRWQVFGNLFAGVGGVRYRIDRHPTMSRHPVTPIHESDLRLHLAKQTNRPIEAIDTVDMVGSDCQIRIRKAMDRRAVVFLDVFDEISQVTAGRLVWENRGKTLFTASSSGLQYALVAYWQALGQLSKKEKVLSLAPPVDKLLVLSGSCSPATAEQITYAEAAGFASVRIDVIKFIDFSGYEEEVSRVIRLGLEALQEAKNSLIIYAARTVDDEAFIKLKAYCEKSNTSFSSLQARIGSALGAIAESLIEKGDISRFVIAGGDTSGRVIESLPISALEAVHPLAPGSPICRIHSDNAVFDGLEVVLKGGQVGEAEIFQQAKQGIPSIH